MFFLTRRNTKNRWPLKEADGSLKSPALMHFMDKRTPYRQNQPTNVPRDLISSVASGKMKQSTASISGPKFHGNETATGRSRNCALPAAADQWNLFHLQFFFSALFGECRSGNKHSGGAVNQSVGVSRRTKKPSELFPKQKKNRESPVSSLADKLVPQHRPLGGLDRLTDVVIAVKDTVQQPDPEGGRLWSLAPIASTCSGGRPAER